MGLTFMINTLLGKTSESIWKTQIGDLGNKNYPYTFITDIVYFVDLSPPPHTHTHKKKKEKKRKEK
jgi:hypothetical protein